MAKLRHALAALNAKGQSIFKEVSQRSGPVKLLKEAKIRLHYLCILSWVLEMWCLCSFVSP